MNETKRRPGRPAKPAVEGERIPLSLRITAELKRNLEAAASGRSLSQEAEFRLERSFSEEDAIGGATMKRLAQVMVASFFLGGERSAFSREGTPSVEEWINDPDCYREAVVSLLDALVHRAPDWQTVEGKDLYFNAIQSRLATRERNEDAR